MVITCQDGHQMLYINAVAGVPVRPFLRLADKTTGSFPTQLTTSARNSEHVPSGA